MRVGLNPKVSTVNFSNRRAVAKPVKIQNIFEKTIKPDTLSFIGTPVQMPKNEVTCAQDAIKQWELCRSAKYFDIHDDTVYPQNRYIRLENYRFLDKINTRKDAAEFVDYFKRFTGFPDVEEVSKRMLGHFDDTINKISKSLNQKYDTECFDILYWGYDPTCSVGQKKAFPGSDLDKAYIIIGGSYLPERKPQYCGLSEKEMVDSFKGEIWDKLDQRLVSVNKPDTFPEVITLRQLKDKLEYLDKEAEKLIERNGENYYKDPMDKTLKDEIEAARFNIDLAKELSKYSTTCSKDDAKRLAFILEVLRENDKIKYAQGGNTYTSQQRKAVRDLCESSPFFRLSNVTQIEAWKMQYPKKKFSERQLLEDRGAEVKEMYTTLPLLIRLQIRYQMGKDGIETYIRNRTGFNGWDTYKQYRLVKDIIRASSCDQGAYSNKEYFDNPFDIKEKYTPLIEMLTE